MCNVSKIFQIAHTMAPKKRKSKLSRGKLVADVDKELKIDEKRNKRDIECCEESLSSKRKSVHVATSSTPSSHKDGCVRGRKTNDSTPGELDGCNGYVAVKLE